MKKARVGLFIMTFAACGALLLPAVQDLLIKFGEFYVGRPLNYPDMWRGQIIKYGRFGVLAHFNVLFWFVAYRFLIR